MTGHTFIQHFIQNEEPLVQRVIRHYAISASLHMRSPFSFSFQSECLHALSITLEKE